MTIASNSPYRKVLYLPDNWDDGWNAAKAAIGTQPANVVVIGDSVLNGGLASNLNATSIRALLRSWLFSLYGQYADFFPNFDNSFSGWGSSGSRTDQRWGFGYLSVPNGSGGSNTLTFTSPYACTAMDIIYFDDFPGTWSYNLDLAGNTIIMNTNNNANASTSSAIKRISLTNLANAAHTLVFASQSASNTCAILGVVCYPNGKTGGGIAFAPLTYAGTLLTDKISTYALNAPVPNDMCWLMQGANPLSFSPGSPSTQITTAASSGGSVDVGTHYYGMTYYGGFGETSVGSSASAGIVIGSGTQTVTVSNIVNGAQQTGYPYAANANKNLYRTKASGSGTPGSGTNPWYLLAQIANGTTSYTDTTADASLTNQQPPSVQPTFIPAGAFGFPTQPHLAIIGMGVNDLAFNYSAANVTNYEITLKRLVRAIKRGQPKTSIVLFVEYMPDVYASDGGSFASGNSLYWHQYVDAIYNVAIAENCAVVNNDRRWQPFAVTNGFVNANDVHPTDLGNADELGPFLGIL